MKLSRLLILGLAMFLLSAAFAAAQPRKGLYLNAKWGKTDANGSIGNVFDAVVDGDDEAQTFEIGWRFSSLVAIQGGYHNLGTIPGKSSLCPPGIEMCEPTPIEADTIAYSLAFVPQLPLSKSFTIFLKVGVVALESEVSAIREDTSEFLEKLSDEDIIYGAGLKLRVLSGLSFFYEYEFVGSDLEVQSLGLSWQF